MIGHFRAALAGGAGLAIFMFHAAGAALAAAPVVHIDTVFGDIQIELFHEETPKTVGNFLSLVASGRYEDQFFHRSVANFVLQGGGFAYPNDDVGLVDIEDFGNVMNEPGISNTRGTVAMAKQAGNPHSATNQFFINLKDNSADLDGQNGGFTVFGRVVNGTMTVVDQLAAVQRYNLNPPSQPFGPFGSVPLHNYTGGPLLKHHLLVSESITAATQLPGDYNANGTVEQGDLDLVLLNWGKSAVPLPSGWFQDLPDGVIDQNELDGILLNWGNRAAGSQLGAASIPEPATWLLAIFACCSSYWSRRRRSSS